MAKVGWGIAGVAAASAAYEWIEARQDAHRFPAPDQLVDIGDGRSIHVRVRGQGGPTVVIETGLGSRSYSWHGIQDELAERATVVTYERAGYGWSTPGAWPLTVDKVVDDLQAVVRALELPEPLILVGHSLGGIYVRAFAKRHPEEVAGLVFVDSSHEDQNRRMAATLGPARMATLMSQSLVMMLPPRGMVRAVRRTGALDKMLPQLIGQPPAELREAVIAQTLSAGFRRTTAGEQFAFLAKAPEALAPGELGHMPLVVITAGKPLPPEVKPNVRAAFEAMRPLWKELQAELAALSSDARHVIADDAGHMVNHDRPDLVRDLVAEVVDAVRAGRRVAVPVTE